MPLRKAAAALVAVAAFGITGCATPTDQAASHMTDRSASPTRSVSAFGTVSAAPRSAAPPTPAPPPTQNCPLPDTGFDCDLQQRIVAVEQYLTTRPGTAGVVLHDQQTGAMWHNDHAKDPMWTASTIKLAMVVDLFTRNRRGEITLTDEDRSLIRSMLRSSDDDAADTLWFRYAGPDHMSFNDNFPAYGMTFLVPQKGFTKYFPYWGFQKCTPEDLDRLIHYVLTDLPADERAYILGEMRNVGPNQRWGVWGAGPAAHPGNKNGWSEEQGGWVMNTVGFVGDDQRYTLVVMDNLRGEGGYDEGRETVTHVSELLFAGRY